MRVLYLSQYFPPEIGATQTRAYEMARGLIAAGHAVTMLTEVPNHPAGVIPPAYRGRAWYRESLDGIDVLRLRVWASPVKTPLRRIAFYSSYMLMAILAGLVRLRGRYDVVVATSPPLLVVAAGLALSAIRRIPLVFEVRDLWPQAAIELGELNPSWARRLATWLEELCYRHARRVVVVSNRVCEKLGERGVPPARLEVIPNGVNVETYQPLPPEPELRASLGLDPGQFVVAFAGLHGLAQDLATILEAAERLAADSEIVFLLIGDGPRKAETVARARAMSLRNVIFHGAVPDIDLARYLALARAGLHAARRLEISRGMLPVKIFSYMACALPVILAMEGEAADLVETTGAGIVVAPEDPDALASAVRRLRESPAEARRCGEAGRTFARAHLSREDLARRLASTLEEVVDSEKRRSSR